MKKIVLLSVLLSWPWSEAYPLTVELRNISNGELSSQIYFDSAAGGALYQGARQYLRIDNPGPIQREVRIYADLSAWQTFAESNPVPIDTFSLHSIGFSAPQSGEGVDFNSGVESYWKTIRDATDSGANPMEVTLQPNEVRYIYFGAKTPFAAPGVSYQTKMTVEVIGGAAQNQEIQPKQTVLTPNGDGINDLAIFGITGSFEIKIFNIKGKPVRSLQNINTWDGRDDAGNTVEIGVYVYKVKSLGVKVSGMLAVAR